MSAKQFIRFTTDAGRRYFRFFRFLDCFQKAQECFDSEGGWSDIVFGVGKWSFLGLYMGLESLTIVPGCNGIYPTSWAETFMVEANKFWFYSLVLSVVSGLLRIFWLSRTHPVFRGISTTLGTPSKEYEQEEAEKLRLEARLKGRTLKRRLVTDLFDLFIPGHVTGWMRTGTVWVGIASMVSTTLSSIDVWDRVR
ncbi:peroxisomal biogenesis factor 11 [Bisporella sp. PMI_857]|nr:peroxisomal biogenesis factor 11 [Bisporella sp. PMI_857]